MKPTPWRRFFVELLIGAAASAWLALVTLHVLGIGPRACP
jgi:hypothetical protein